jgi:hypothetical protein
MLNIRGDSEKSLAPGVTWLTYQTPLASTEIMSAFGTQKIKTLTTLLMLCRARMNRQLQVKPKGSVYLPPLQKKIILHQLSLYNRLN